jgi:hypothetical protein
VGIGAEAGGNLPRGFTEGPEIPKRQFLREGGRFCRVGCGGWDRWRGWLGHATRL